MVIMVVLEKGQHERAESICVLEPTVTNILKASRELFPKWCVREILC